MPERFEKATPVFTAGQGLSYWKIIPTGYSTQTVSTMNRMTLMLLSVASGHVVRSIQSNRLQLGAVRENCPLVEVVMTYIHKCKCMSCGLHFAVFSWEEKKSNLFCPECGKQAGVNSRQLRWIEKTDDQIFEYIPGKFVPLPPATQEEAIQRATEQTMTIE